MGAERPSSPQETPRSIRQKDGQRQVSWLSGHRLAPAFPEKSSGTMGRETRRLQLRGQLQNETADVKISSTEPDSLDRCNGSEV